MVEDKFWVVFSSTLREAPSAHASLDVAERCARRLAVEIPASTFYVAAVVSGYGPGLVRRIDMVDPF